MNSTKRSQSTAKSSIHDNMFMAVTMTPKPMANIEDFIEKNKPQYCRPIIDAK